VQIKNTTRATHYDEYYQNVYPGAAVNAAGNLTLSAYNNANQRTNFQPDRCHDEGQDGQLPSTLS
jgi:catecholate siderophore receptor